ncbi:MAG TPA: hypothetical protein VM866_04685 [Pyrinomonadaceae bacterium]|nr:hypothetical protein [Pyrinomonadaceae bacterium]
MITGGSLELFSDTPFNTYEVAADKKQISHPKEGNTVVRLKVQVKSFTATISLYDKKVDGRCNVEAFYTGDAGEDTVRVFTNSMGKKLKIKFKRKRFDEYDVLGEKTRVHPDGDNKLTRIEITNGSEVTNLTDLSDRCKIIFTYED